MTGIMEDGSGNGVKLQEKQRLKDAVSVYNNNRSFWLRKKDLAKVLHDVGFDSVFEQFDYTGDIAPDNYTSRHSRTMFVAVKH